MPKHMLAYLPRRSGQEAVRLLLDSIDNDRIRNADLFLLQADLESAFDSLSKPYLLSVLEKLNLPSIFLDRVSRLLNLNVANLFLNGHTVGHINITSSIGQGDPFSVLAFNVGILPLTAALLAQSTNNSFRFSLPKNPKLPMPTLNGHLHDSSVSSYEVPLLNYADDNISFPASLDDVPSLLRVYDDFRGLSNLRININKTILAANRKLTIFELKALLELGFSFDKIKTSITFLGHDINLNRCFEQKVDKSILIEAISDRLTKTCNLLNRFYFSQYAKELIVHTYINSVCTYRLLPFHFTRSELDQPQKIMDAFVMPKAPYTKGNQRYLPSKLGGVGCIQLYSHLKAASHFWLKRLFSNFSLSIGADLARHALETIGLNPKDLLHCSKWELKIISNILIKNYGLEFWGQLILTIPQLAKTLNTDSYCFTANLSDSAYYASKNFDTNTIRNFSRKFSLHYLNNLPSIFDPQWREFI